jgi:hypothetical protein
MKKETFSGMATRHQGETLTAWFSYEVTVTAEDIAETYVYGQPEFTVEEVEAWTDEQFRAYVKEHMLEERVREVEGYGDDVLIFSVFVESDPGGLWRP